jgi:metallo-beta-lactamase family protein
MNNATLSFYGGAQEVTGACYLLEAADKKILVDCGLFQGSRFSDEKNQEPFPFDPKAIDALVVTHGHIDHIGRIPKLYREGFRGKIYATSATCDLMEVMLEDAFYLMSKECRDNQETCLYFEEDFREVKTLFHPIEYHKKIIVAPDISFELLNAGHILGSSFVRFVAGGKIILFTGDVGARESVLLPPHDEVRDANVLVIESAYGNRLHQHRSDKTLLLERAIEDIARKKGTLLIPVFATERTQDILFEINEMLEFKRIPPMSVFLDSPLAIRVTEVFKHYPDLYTDAIQKMMREHKHLFDFKHLVFAETKEDSKKINEVSPPKVILAGSGMMTGGRILHHATRYLQDKNSILLIVGWQAAGSLGRRLLDHAAEVKIRGEMIPVRAETRVIDGYSAHADQDELLEFVARTRDTLKNVFVVQGDQDAAMHLTQTIRDKHGVEARAPRFGEKFEI